MRFESARPRQRAERRKLPEVTAGARSPISERAADINKARRKSRLDFKKVLGLVGALSGTGTVGEAIVSHQMTHDDSPALSGAPTYPGPEAINQAAPDDQTVPSTAQARIIIPSKVSARLGVPSFNLVAGGKQYQGRPTDPVEAAVPWVQGTGGDTIAPDRRAPYEINYDSLEHVEPAILGNGDPILLRNVMAAHPEYLSRISPEVKRVYTEYIRDTNVLALQLAQLATQHSMGVRWDSFRDTPEFAVARKLPCKEIAAVFDVPVIGPEEWGLIRSILTQNNFSSALAGTVDAKMSILQAWSKRCGGANPLDIASNTMLVATALMEKQRGGVTDFSRERIVEIAAALKAGREQVAQMPLIKGRTVFLFRSGDAEIEPNPSSARGGTDRLSSGEPSLMFQDPDFERWIDMQSPRLFKIVAAPPLANASQAESVRDSALDTIRVSVPNSTFFFLGHAGATSLSYAQNNEPLLLSQVMSAADLAEAFYNRLKRPDIRAAYEQGKPDIVFLPSCDGDAYVRNVLTWLRKHNSFYVPIFIDATQLGQSEPINPDTSQDGKPIHHMRFLQALTNANAKTMDDVFSLLRGTGIGLFMGSKGNVHVAGEKVAGLVLSDTPVSHSTA